MSHSRGRRGYFTVWPLCLVSALAFLEAFTLVQAEPWPAGTSPINIGPVQGGLPDTQEVSGAVWNPILQRLFVVDDNSGRISSMDVGGSNKVSWAVGLTGDRDHEAITFADWSSDYVYVGVEQSPVGTNARKIRKFDISGSSNAVLVQSWTLTQMGGSANAGLEGLTFVPDAFLKKFPAANGFAYNGGNGSQFGAGGLFFASLQADGFIYVYDLDIVSNTTNKVFVNKFIAASNRIDLAGLEFDRSSGLMYLLWDAANVLGALVLPSVEEPGGHLFKEWALWNGDAAHGGTASARSDEGVAVANNCTGGGGTRLFITDDTGENIYRFDQWPCFSGNLAGVTFVSLGSTWRYLDDGSNQGTGWRGPAFNDNSWTFGPAELGYGDGGETTVIDCGPTAPACTNNNITAYFRQSFSVTDPSAFGVLKLRLLRDDGAVVYLKGGEILRSNMPGGTINHLTLASIPVGGIDETTLYEYILNAASLVAGTNVIAVEIHQAFTNSSDVSFDLELIGSDTAVTRGPYLQSGTANSVVVRWRTPLATDSRVRYGSAPLSLPSVADDPAITTEHEVRLTGLTPGTRYFYSVGSTVLTLAGGDGDHFFDTSPLTGTAQPTRVWVLGDSGTADGNAADVRDAYLAFTGSRHTDLWLMLGDNAYLNGTDQEYQNAVFDLYATILQKSVLWPTIGNHDTAGSDTPAPTIPYFHIFTLPTNGVAGGMASGTENYYSFDYANIHFICLDSMASGRSSNGVMGTWLQTDLGSTTQKWTVAFWHHPPYSKGSHDSDNNTSDLELVQMRENILPILEAAGVDLVLCGHSHSYERSFLLDGHYGFSNTLTPAMILDDGSGREDETGVYLKASDTPHAGAVYVVAGSSGQLGVGPLNHPAMFLSLNALGSLVLDIEADRLDATFIDNTGAVRDYFTLLKGGLPTVTLLTTDANAAEAGADKGTFKVVRTGSTAAALTVQYSVSGTAANGSDYSALSGTRIIPAGTNMASITVTPVDDAAPEAAETVTLTLSANAAYNIGSPSSGTVTIADNDSTSTTVKVTATDAVASEPGSNTGKFTVTRMGPANASLKVFYTVGGSATPGNDYTALSGTVTIQAGKLSKVITVKPLNNGVPEPAETVILTLKGTNTYTVGSPGSATVTINDND